MIEIIVVLDDTGNIFRMNLKGHAENIHTNGMEKTRRPRLLRNLRHPKIVPMNPACAAVTMVARTVARLTASRPGWIVGGDAPNPGDLSLEIIGRPEDTDEWLRGVTDTLLQALADIEEEYPLAVSVHIEEFLDGS